MSSDKINLSPEELERFARTLKGFSEGLSQGFSSLRGHLQHLGSEWHDPSFVHWSTEFEAASKSIQKFIHASQEHHAFLMKKAQASRAARDVKF